MRKKLKDLGAEDRHTFIGTFERFGFKNAFKGPPLQTVLLLDIKEATSGSFVTDHLWFTKTKGFDKLGLKQGDVVQFDARVASYTKGYQGDWDSWLEKDYKLSYPTKLVKLNKESFE